MKVFEWFGLIDRETSPRFRYSGIAVIVTLMVVGYFFFGWLGGVAGMFVSFVVIAVWRQRRSKQ